MKTLVILAHPDIEHSKVNRRWKEELLLHPEDITLHELYKQYPNNSINVEEEQKLVEKYENIILQFPFYWYSYPPLLKKWFDDVFTYGWAYGSNGKKLNHKNFRLAVSIGDKESNYTHEGDNTFTVEELLAPFQATALHVGANYFPPFLLFGASFQKTDEEIDHSAKQYVEYIFKNK